MWSVMLLMFKHHSATPEKKMIVAPNKHWYHSQERDTPWLPHTKSGPTEWVRMKYKNEVDTGPTK